MGMHMVVVSGTHVGNIDGQLRARPRGPGSLHLCLNRGSEVFRVGPDGPELVHRRVATTAEDAALDRAAALTVEYLAQRGLRAATVAQRLNRRKIDLIPEPAWADPPKAHIADLASAVQARLRAAGIMSLAEVVRLAATAAAAEGLDDARVTSDIKHVEIGITDKSDSAHWVFAHLGCAGVGSGLVLIAGDEFGNLGGVRGSDDFMLVAEACRATAVSVGAEPDGVPPEVLRLGGGPPAFADVLRHQLSLRREGAAPRVDGDPGWSIRFVGRDQYSEPQREALLTLADGFIGTSATAPSSRARAGHLVVVGGIYRGSGPRQELMHAPVWNVVETNREDPIRLERRLDLRSGMLEQIAHTANGPVRVVQLSSLARPGCAVMRIDAPEGAIRAGPALSAPLRHEGMEAGQSGDRQWIRVWSRANGGVTAAASHRVIAAADAWHHERMAAYVPGPAGAPSSDVALARLSEMEATGYEGLLNEHRGAWAQRWDEAEVSIEGDGQLELAVRFAIFHLIASVGTGDETAVGARGLSGSAYRGHVFWDADVFVLPFFAATHPASARAMLEYRARRLPAAFEAARVAGRSGARFPWESATSGQDVTPRSVSDHPGHRVSIRSGRLEEHIVADVAWAAACYADWTGDLDFMHGAGGSLLVETARYWASRVRVDRTGRGHIDRVEGPDEYHEGVNDNAFTNVMARWNLRRAATLARAGTVVVPTAEVGNWLRLAEDLVDGYDSANGLYEQFPGFFELEPLIIRDVAPRRPIAADVLLGRDRVRGAQVIKQADVLMLHHLVPDEVAPGSLLPNLKFYEPRTAHGSSLSPGVHAALFARAGMLTEATEALRLAAAVDLEDRTRTTSGGIHLATMGSVWQALAFGMLGIRPGASELSLAPRLPPGWSALALRIAFRGVAVRIRLEAETLRVDADGPTTVRIGAGGQVHSAARGPAPAKDRGRLGGAGVTRVLAAVDRSAATTPVLSAAVTLSGMLGAEVDAVHVQEAPGSRPMVPRTACRQGCSAGRLLMLSWPRPGRPTSWPWSRDCVEPRPRKPLLATSRSGWRGLLASPFSWCLLPSRAPSNCGASWSRLTLRQTGRRPCFRWSTASSERRPR